MATTPLLLVKTGEQNQGKLDATQGAQVVVIGGVTRSITHYTEPNFSRLFGYHQHAAMLLWLAQP
jgi:hypothetical protein